MFAAFLVTLSSGMGAFTLQEPSQYDKEISEHVKFVQNQVDRVASAQSEPVLKFRYVWQTAQGDISTLYTESKRDSDLNPDELEKNKQYQEYLFSASDVIFDLSEGKQPDRTALNNSAANLIID